MSIHRLYPRPAGMSDEDDDDDDDFYVSTGRDYKICGNGSSKVIPDDNVQENEKQILECRVRDACIMGQMDIIKEYFKEHYVDEFLHTGWTPLLYATSWVQYKVVEYLLEHNADVNKHKDGFTPLMALCSSVKETNQDRIKCLLLLLDAGVDVNVTNRQRETALIYACKFQSAEFVLELIKHVKDINICDSDGKTALIHAVTCNRIETVKILLNYDADDTLTDRYNLTPKEVADIKGFTEISDLFADVEEDKRDTLPLCKVSSQFSELTWKDLFPNLYSEYQNFLDYNIWTVLHGMCLERYSVLFQGMDLKTFLHLTESDLCNLGIDITVHREQFLESLHKFHITKWNMDSIGFINKFLPYTIYDGVMSLQNVKKQIGVISSSFQYIKNNMIQAKNENIDFNSKQRMNYKQELKNIQKTLKQLQNEIMKIKKVAQKIHKKNHIGVPAHFIPPFKKNEGRPNWIILLSVTLIVGCVYQTRRMLTECGV